MNTVPSTNIVIKIACIITLMLILEIGVAVAQDNLSEALVTYFDYDAVISRTQNLVSQQNISSSDGKTLVLAGSAYYFKGRLLLSAYQANIDLLSEYFECKGSKGSKLQKSIFLPFAQGMLDVSRLQLTNAVDHFAAYRKTTNDKIWKARASLWLGCLFDKLGKKEDRDLAWKDIDWKDLRNISERWMVLSLLGQTSLPDLPTQFKSREFNDPLLARNLILTRGALNQLTRSEKVGLLRILELKKPFYELKDEKYYESFSLLAAGRCALNISRDILINAEKILSDEVKRQAPSIKFFEGFSSYLIDDIDQTIAILKEDKVPRSLVFLGAAYYRSGDKQRAEEIWKPLEQSGDVKTLSWLGYAYALLGIKLDKAEEFSSRFLNNPDEAQSVSRDNYSHLAAVYERKAKEQRDSGKQLDEYMRARDILNRGYNPSKNGLYGREANDPEYTVLYCAAMERVDGTRMWDVNKILNLSIQKYDYLTQLAETATSITICREIKAGK